MTKTNIVCTLMILATAFIIVIARPADKQNVPSEHPVVSSQTDNEIEPAAVAGIVGQM